MNYKKVFSNLYLIDLDQKMTGFRKFISAWLYIENESTFLVDPGPKYSIETLIKALKEIGIDKLDYVLLTHIHIDHAGGTGRLLEEYPMAKVICHPKGIKHMINPEKLWKGSLKVLGKIAESYEEIIPIPAEKISFQEQIPMGNSKIDVIDTPGHAAHHLSYHFNEYLFAGEVAGLNQSLPNRIYTRPATPPVFELDISLSSIDKVIALNPQIICYGHYGFRQDADTALKTAREQFILWTEIVKEQLQQGDDNLRDRVFEQLKIRDKIFANIQYQDDDIKSREENFIINSVNGMKQYLEALG